MINMTEIIAILKKILLPEVYLPIIYFFIAIFIFKKTKKWILKRLEKVSQKSRNAKRYLGLVQLTINVVKVVIISIFLLSILTVFGFNIKSILASIGIFSAVLSLSLQDILRDFFAGISIIIENQIGIGDNIEVAGFKGEVIKIGIKAMKIRAEDGSVFVIANRNIANFVIHPRATV